MGVALLRRCDRVVAGALLADHLGMVAEADVDGDGAKAPRPSGRPSSRIMYVERKTGSSSGEARIGRVTFSKSGSTVYYGDQELRRLTGGGSKANHYDVATGEEYWISGPKRSGGDRLYGEPVLVHVDEDVREEYWCSIRGLPHRVGDRDASH